MEELYTVAFAGHRDVLDFRRVEERLYAKKKGKKVINLYELVQNED